MRKFAFAAVFVALALAAGTAAADMKKVTLGTEGAYPPFNWIDENGELKGFDVDIGNALCAAASLDCTWVVQDWDGIIPGLLAKKYDAIVASMSITEERKQKVDFTARYYNTPAKFVRMKDSGIEISNEGLEGLAVGVQRATIHENFLRDNYGDIVTIRAYATQDEANLDFASGRVDLLLADSVVLAGGLPQHARRRGRGVRGARLYRPAMVRRRRRDRGAQGRGRAARRPERSDRRDPRRRHLQGDQRRLFRLRRLRRLTAGGGPAGGTPRPPALSDA